MLILIVSRIRKLLRSPSAYLFARINYILIALIIAITVSFSPFYDVLKKLTGISLYSKLAAIIFIIAIVEMARERKIFFLIKKENYFSNFLLISFLLVLFFKNISLNNAHIILSAILTPYLFGILISFSFEFLRKFFYFLLCILIIKLFLFLLYILYNGHNLALTPQLGDRALYLYVVNYFELLPGLSLLLLPDYLNRFYFFSSKKYLIHLIMLMFLLAIAISISILNSRGVIINSLLITALLTFIFSKNKLVNFYGYLIYPLILYIALLMTPLRLEYIKRIFHQFKNALDCFLLNSPYRIIDVSFSERLANIHESLSHGSLNLINYGSDKVINGSHFWLAQIYYAGGLFALILFIGLLLLTGFKFLKISSRYEKNTEICIKAFLIGSFSHIFYYGNFLNSITFFLFLGLILNLEVSSKRAK